MSEKFPKRLKNSVLISRNLIKEIFFFIFLYYFLFSDQKINFRVTNNGQQFLWKEEDWSVSHSEFENKIVFAQREIVHVWTIYEKELHL